MYSCTLQINEICNLKCKYCYEGKKANNIMLFNTAKKAIELAVKNTIIQEDRTLLLNFIGGEPLITFSLIEKITEFVKMKANESNIKVKFTVTTNGTVLSEKIMFFLINENFEVKLSLDGDEYINDINRITEEGIGSYNLIMDNLNLLRKYEQNTNNPIQVSMVVSKNNYNYFFESFKHIINLGFKDVDSAINSYEDWNENEKNILKKEFLKVFNFTKQENLKGNYIHWRLYEKFFIAYDKGINCSYSCKAGILSMYVNFDGSIYACKVDENISPIGHVDTGLNYSEIRKTYLCKDKIVDKCKKCSIIDKCSSRTCYAMNNIINKDKFEPVDILCFSNKVFLEIIENKGVLNNELCG